MNDQPPPSPRAPVQYRVGDLLIDVGRQQVTRGADVVALPKLSYDMLLTLVQEAPNLVGNDTFMERVWPKLIVSPETISQRVKLLRDALGDDPRQPRYIEGLRGRGYRLIPVVERDPAPLAATAPPVAVASQTAAPQAVPTVESPPAQSPDVAPQRNRPRRRWSLASVAGAAAAALLAVWFALHARKTSVEVVAVQPRAVAVLPFENLSAEPGNDFIALGVAESVLNRLGTIHNLLVTARSSSFALGKTAQDAREAGRMLGVRYLVEGSVQRAGMKLRVNAVLIDAETNKELWSLSVDRKLDDVFAVQDEIAGEVAQKLAVSLQGPTDEYAKYGTEAYLAFLQGRALLESRKIADLETAVKDFSHALELAPTFAAAMTDLAYARYVLASVDGSFNKQSMQLVPQLRALADRAIQLDPAAGEPYYLRATLAVGDSHSNLPTAEADFRKGFELAPNFALGVYDYGGYLFDQNRYDEALALLDRASLLNPLAPSTHYLKGLILRQMSGTFDQSVAAFEQAIAVGPDFYPAYTRLAQLRVHQGRLADAIKLAEKAMTVEPKADWFRMVLFWMYIDSGELDAARDIGRGFQPQSAHEHVATALLCYRGGHLEQAESSIVKALKDPDLDPVGYPFYLASQAVVVRAIATDAPAHGRDYLLSVPGVVKEHGQLAVVDDNLDFVTLLAALERRVGDPKLADDLARRELVLVDKSSEMAGFPGGNDLERASVLALLGRDDEALTSLETMVRTGNRVHWWSTLETDPSLTELHGTPRFQAIVESTRVWLAGQQQLLEQMRQHGEIPQRAVAAVPGGC